jgi:hypothetical protein
MLIQVSTGCGMFAFVMLMKIIRSIQDNESLVELVKRMHDKNNDGAKPKRTRRQVASMIFGQSRLSFMILVPINVRPPLSMELVRESEKVMYSSVRNERYLKADAGLISQ